MRNPWNAVIAEIAGTFLFFFVGIGAAGWVSRAVTQGSGMDPASALIVVALAHGVALAVLVSAMGAISGAHFNPAVTAAVWIAGQMPGRRAAAYMIAQLIGGILAAWMLRALYPADVFPELGIPRLTGIDPLQGIAVEAVLTVVLLAAVFGTAIDPRAPKVGGLAIGLAVAADILMGGPLTGAAMNPARWFGPAVVTGDYSNSYVWIVGPIIGAVIAALAYRFLFLAEADLDRTPADPTA
ncbi:MAG TPA: aquaporin [Candidatus Limnocylindrales bacterium]|nr:aquaporin [Candidatus Limnocylindrales bacterium]